MQADDLEDDSDDDDEEGMGGGATASAAVNMQLSARTLAQRAAQVWLLLLKAALGPLRRTR